MILFGLAFGFIFLYEVWLLLENYNAVDTLLDC